MGLEQIRARELELELARSRERERIANQLHDSVAQRPFTIGAIAQASRAGRGAISLIDAIGEIESTATDARRELRDTLLRLHDGFENLPFDVQLDGELRLLEDVTGCTARVVRRGSLTRMPDRLARLMIDTAVEGMRNAVKHAHARLVEVEVIRDERRLILTVVTPSGAVTPAPPVDTSASGTGIGLLTLRARAEGLGGSLELTTASAGRTVRQLELPYQDLGAR